MNDPIDPPSLLGTTAEASSWRETAERRLLEIRETLGLNADHFERAHLKALAAADGSHDKILAEQVTRLNDALLGIEDPLTRERIVSLAEALVDEKPSQH